MKKVVLLGDSIRMVGYGAKVAQALESEYNVWQPKDNCRFASYTLRMLFEHRSELADADIIHWNNGHWDVCNLFGDGPFTPLEIYLDTLKQIAGQLLSITDKVIFATTTPVNAYPYEDNTIIFQYNTAAAAVLRKMGVQINDLYALVEPQVEACICQDQLHLSDTGAQICAQQVINAIRQAER